MRFCISFPGIHAVGISYPVSISAGVRNVDYPRYSFGEYPGQCRGVRFCFPWFPVPLVYAIRQGGIIRVTSFPGIKTPIKGALFTPSGYAIGHQVRHPGTTLGIFYAIGVRLSACFTPLVYAIGHNYAIGHGLTA